MTAADWLARHSAGVPTALAARVSDALQKAPAGQPAGEQMVSAAEHVLRGALAADPMTRAQALDLLAADALVTHAFEALCDEPAALADRADDALRRLGSLGV